MRTIAILGCALVLAGCGAPIPSAESPPLSDAHAPGDAHEDDAPPMMCSAAGGDCADEH